MSFAHENAPASTGRGISKQRAEIKASTPSITHSSERADIFGHELNGIHIAVVSIKSPGPDKRFRRYYFADLRSAQRRVDKSRQAGREAYLYLGQISIVDGDHLD